MEFIFVYYFSSDLVNGSSNWKNLISILGFYPQTLSQEQIFNWSSLGSLSGIFTTHHSMAMYLVSILPLLFFYRSLFFKRLFFFYLIIFLSLTSFFLTNSRFVIISFFLICIVFLYKDFKKYLVLLFGFSFILFFFGFIDRFGNVYSNLSLLYFNIISFNYDVNFISDFLYYYALNSSSDSSSSFRILYNWNSINIISEFPFFGSGSLGFSQSGSLKANPHSLYLILIQTFGLIPFFFFFIFLLKLFILVKKYFFSSIYRSHIFIFLLFFILSFGVYPLSDFRTCFIFLISFSSLVSNLD
jgi:hypothetical protein